MSTSCRVKVFKRYAESGGPQASHQGKGDWSEHPRRARPRDCGIRTGTRMPLSDGISRRMTCLHKAGNYVTPRYPDRMRIDRIIASPEPTFSVGFFPPKTPEATEQLYATAHSLKEIQPDFVSVTYGAGGSNRDGMVEISGALHNDVGLETMAHLSCVGETREGLREVLDRVADTGIENVFALRGDPPRGQIG